MGQCQFNDSHPNQDVLNAHFLETFHSNYYFLESLEQAQD